jgi:REP element-mobilizing transposase RayT
VNGAEKRLQQIISQVAKEWGCDGMELEIMPDHIHLFCEIDPPLGYINSCSASRVGAPIAVLKQYIENQEDV